MVQLFSMILDFLDALAGAVAIACWWCIWVQPAKQQTRPVRRNVPRSTTSSARLGRGSLRNANAHAHATHAPGCEAPLTVFGMEDAEMAKVWLEMTPMQPVGQPDESLMTGSIVLADGGYTCW
jgi:hypothetical protein